MTEMPEQAAPIKQTGDLSELELAFGIADPSLQGVELLDPPLAAGFSELARTVRSSNALSEKDQHLIHIALNAAVVHMQAGPLRAHINAALKAGATAGEIREVLQLTSVLGIHGTIPGVLILCDAEGGLDEVKSFADAERTARAQKAHQAFETKRGPLTPAWQACTYYIPELVEAYASFSSVPWETDHLSDKTKELIYVAIDLMPQHTHMEGTRVHMQKAKEKGATADEIRSVVQMIVLMGIQTPSLALPILSEELSKLADENGGAME